MAGCLGERDARNGNVHWVRLGTGAWYFCGGPVSVRGVRAVCFEDFGGDAAGGVEEADRVAGDRARGRERIQHADGAQFAVDAGGVLLLPGRGRSVVGALPVAAIRARGSRSGSPGRRVRAGAEGRALAALAPLEQLG